MPYTKLMRIDAFANDDQILIELGERLRFSRVRAALTQSQLSKESGVAKSTIERAENGKSVQLSSLVKILRALNKISSLELLLPVPQATPFESLRKKEPKMRVRSSAATPYGSFKWGDDQ